jgi:hypothetical protein
MAWGAHWRPPGFDAPVEAALFKAGAAEALAELLTRVLEPRRAEACSVLIIDQLEELFTAVEPDLADEVLKMLTGTLGQPRLRVLAAIRVDGLHHCVARPELIPILNGGGLFVLGPPIP